MKIEHIALWTNDLQCMIDFYVQTFHASASTIYVNKQKKFKSSFISFESGARLELMTISDVQPRSQLPPITGLAHFCLSVGSKEAVDALTEHCRIRGIHIKSKPRTTGDGYYESVILDPDGNEVELSI